MQQDSIELEDGSAPAEVSYARLEAFSIVVGKLDAVNFSFERLRHESMEGGHVFVIRGFLVGGTRSAFQLFAHFHTELYLFIGYRWGRLGRV